ncbi:MAG TPA: HD domain-containing phosphohydrolase [Acidimicrobiia bacterium]|nr:HD domain-containing phosphohydrolase [Acidimicrobiia bacterium]
MKPLTIRQIRIAAAYALGGLVCLVALWLRVDAPPLILWSILASAFIVLELRAVEVNDRMLQSSGLMVLLTAGALFAIRSDSSAALAMAAMAALGPILPDGIFKRQWFQPIANFGQMVVSATVAGLLLDWLLSGLVLSTFLLLQVALAGALASLVYTGMNVIMVGYAVRYVYGTRTVLPWSGLHVLLPSQVLMGFLGGLLGAAFHLANKQAVIVLILIVYLFAHLSLSSYSQLREAHQAALRGFVKALEARDLYTRGHTERVAYFAQLIGEQLRFTGTQLERIRWACLIHDLGKLAIPGELVAKRGRLTPEEFKEMRTAARSVEAILAEVDFLRPMVSIAGVHYIDLEKFDASAWSLEASIVATADTFDALTSTRRYRMAMPQTEAYAELRSDPSGRFYPEVISALESALKRTGEVYGGAQMTQSEQLSRAEEAQLA